MIRVVKHGYRAEPRLLLASLAMTAARGAARRPGRLWLALITDGLVHHHQTRLYVGAAGPRGLGDPDVGAAGHARPHHPAARRPAQHHVPGPRRPAPGRGRHGRAPRAAGLPRPDRGAAHRRLRARPPVPLDVHDGRLAAAPGLRLRPARRHPPGAAPAPRRRAAAARWSRSGGPRSRSAPRSASPPTAGWGATCSPSPPRRPPARRCGSPATRPTSSGAADDGVGAVVRPDPGHPPRQLPPG